MSNNLVIVSVVNNFDIYDKAINNNPALSKYKKVIYDNNIENIGISRRYNSFIDGYTKSDKDFWIAFCHQDFMFLENPINKLKFLNKNNIYGAVGIGYGSFIIWPTSFKVLRELYRRPRLFIQPRRALLGEIYQGRNSFEDYFKHGEYQLFPITVETVDCCCIIVHSSLIKKYGLKFDEALDFHLYSEEFSINAKINHGIKTKVVQLKCMHYSLGTPNESFLNSFEYLKEKYKGIKVYTTVTD